MKRKRKRKREMRKRKRRRVNACTEVCLLFVQVTHTQTNEQSDRRHAKKK